MADLKAIKKELVRSMGQSMGDLAGEAIQEAVEQGGEPDIMAFNRGLANNRGWATPHLIKATAALLEAMPESNAAKSNAAFVSAVARDERGVFDLFSRMIKGQASSPVSAVPSAGLSAQRQRGG